MVREENRYEDSEKRYLQLQTGAELSDGRKNKPRRKMFIQVQLNL
jgi:hypothetical protein